MTRDLKEQLITLIETNMKLIDASIKLREENKQLREKLGDVNALYLRAMEDKKRVLSKMTPSMN